MAIDVSEQLTVHDLVIETSARTYQLHGYEVRTRHQLTPRQFGRRPFDLVVPEIRRVEEVETEETLGSLDLERLLRCRRAGLQVWVLVPLKSIGAVSARLRGSADHLIPFWLADGDVRFGPPRLP